MPTPTDIEERRALREKRVADTEVTLRMALARRLYPNDPAKQVEFVRDLDAQLLPPKLGRMPTGPYSPPDITKIQHPGSDQVFEALLRQRRLSTRDKDLARRVFTAPDVREADAKHELSPANFATLEAAIAAETRPEVRALLIEEHNKLKGQAANLIGPIDNTAPPAGFLPPRQSPNLFPLDQQPSQNELRFPPRG